MSVINEAEAQATLAVLTELGNMQEEMAAMQEGES
jgi:hydrogenase expression/formation protein HypC